MTSGYICVTIFFDTVPEELALHYEATAEPANGYLVRLDSGWALTDAAATETGNWARQVELATELSDDGATAFSILLVDQHWALAVAHDGRPGPVAVAIPDNSDSLEALPVRLMEIESLLSSIFPDDINSEDVDRLLGELLEGVTPFEDVVAEILAMLNIAPDWIRWSWYETIPEQLFLDPDLTDRVTPLGEAKGLWEE